MTGPRTFGPVTLASAFRTAGFWVGVLLFSPGNLAAQSPFVSGAWCGHLTATSATVSVRLNAPGLRVPVAVSTNDRLSSAVFSPARTTAAASGNLVKLEVEGLQPATDYDYGIEGAGVLRPEIVSRGKFRTFPQGAGSFRLAFSSCGDFQDPDQRAYDAILADQPRLFVQTGDLH